MSETEYDLEDVLQRLLEDHPALLSGGQISPSNPRRFLLIEREAGVPRREGGRDHWNLDHLFVDQDAVPTLVEVKRSSNREIRREIVGQMLDYAANASRYWPIEQIIERFEATCRERGDKPDDELATLLGEGEETEEFWSKVEANLRAGRIRLLFVADAIPPELQAVIEFLNEQMSTTEVLGIEVKQYLGDGVQTLVPRVIGLTATARSAKSSGDRRSFDERLAGEPQSAHELDRRFTRLASDLGLEVTTSKAARQMRADGLTILQLTAHGKLDIPIGPLRVAGLDTEADDLLIQLGLIAGRPLSLIHPWVGAENLIERWEEFTDEFLPSYLGARLRANELRT